MSRSKKDKKSLFGLLFQYFLTGLFTITPIMLTVYILYMLVTWIEGVFYKLMPESSFPTGIGFVSITILLVVIGFISSVSFFQNVSKKLEDLLLSIPIFRSLYKSIKGISDYFNPNNQVVGGKSVVVTIPELGCKMMGFLTRENVDDIDDKLDKGDELVAVYLPMSYQVGGFTVFVKQKYVEKIDVNMDQLLQGTLMAWVQDTSKK